MASVRNNLNKQTLKTSVTRTALLSLIKEGD